jgi:hypothetical protein
VSTEAPSSSWALPGAAAAHALRQPVQQPSSSAPPLFDNMCTHRPLLSPRATQSCYADNFDHFSLRPVREFRYGTRAYGPVAGAFAVTPRVVYEVGRVPEGCFDPQSTGKLGGTIWF